MCINFGELSQTSIIYSFLLDTLMKSSQTDLLEWAAIKNRAQCVYTVYSIEHGFLKKTSYLQWICHLVSEENILIPLCSFAFVFP